ELQRALAVAIAAYRRHVLFQPTTRFSRAASDRAADAVATLCIRRACGCQADSRLRSQSPDNKDDSTRRRPGAAVDEVFATVSVVAQPGTVVRGACVRMHSAVGAVRLAAEL
ncbi:hypothetical protein HK405_002417, partial [Cladochytrium tenue]